MAGLAERGVITNPDMHMVFVMNAISHMLFSGITAGISITLSDRGLNLSVRGTRQTHRHPKTPGSATLMKKAVSIDGSGLTEESGKSLQLPLFCDDKLT